MIEFRMPTLGADMSAGTLTAWLKKPGDTVQRGDIVAEVHTDKADVEVEVFASGVIEELLIEPGTTVPVGTPLAMIREAGAGVESGPPPPTRSAPPAAATETQGAARLVASPSARALAAELNVDLTGIQGTGPHGRIQRADVELAAASPVAPVAPTPAPPAVPPPEPSRPAAAAAAPGAPAPAAERGADRQAGMRRAIAAAMARSKREAPHFYASETIDLSAMTRWLQEENLRRPVERRLLAGAVLLKVAALALREVPELNATWQEGTVVQSADIQLGVAIFLRGGGLVAPALHRADTLSLDELMDAFRDLVARARAGRLRSSELSDPTFTVTSLGERGAESVLPIIFPPQVAIAGFGRIVERPWVSEGQLLVCPVVTATLAADHRVTDGHRASAFLTAVARLLQEPEEL